MMTPEHLPQDWKLLITEGIPKIVHARGCEQIRCWHGDAYKPLPKLKPQKHTICRECEGLAFVTLGASDYLENLPKYRKICRETSPNTLKALFYGNRARCTFVGNHLFLTVKDDRWYIDFSTDEVKLFHNNKKISRRERKAGDCTDPGYHEHPVYGRSGRAQKAFESILLCIHGKAGRANQKRRRKKPRMTLSEYDPETYGFKDI